MLNSLPKRASPEGLHKICSEIHDKTSTVRSITEGLPQHPDYVERHLDYGLLLGFIENDSEEYKLTKRGMKLSYEDGIGTTVSTLFYQAISEAEPYRILLEDLDSELAHDEQTITRDDVAELLRIDYDVVAPEDELSTTIKTAFKTFEAAGLGDFKLGRGQRETRIELYKNVDLSEVAKGDGSVPDTDVETANENPFLDFDQELVSRCLPAFKSGQHQQAVRTAFVILEQRVRDEAGFSYEDHGSSMMAEAFKSGSGELAMGEVENETEGFRFIYQGAFQALRNPNHHHLEDMDRQEAHDILSFINLLLTWIDNQS